MLFHLPFEALLLLSFLGVPSSFDLLLLFLISKLRSALTLPLPDCFFTSVRRRCGEGVAEEEDDDRRRLCRGDDDRRRLRRGDDDDRLRLRLNEGERRRLWRGEDDRLRLRRAGDDDCRLPQRRNEDDRLRLRRRGDDDRRRLLRGDDDRLRLRRRGDDDRLLRRNELSQFVLQSV